MKKTLSLILLCCALPVMAASCAASGPAVDERDLLHHRFVLHSVDGEVYALEEPAPTISFNEGLRVSGSVCNRFMGQGLLADGKLTVGQIATTRMACVDPVLSRYENLILEMLGAGVEAEYRDRTLTLRQGGHTLVYRLWDLVN